MILVTGRGFIGIEEVMGLLSVGDVDAVEHRVLTSDGLELSAVETRDEPFPRNDDVSALLASATDQASEVLASPKPSGLRAAVTILRQAVENDFGLIEWEGVLELADELLRLGAAPLAKEGSTGVVNSGGGGDE